MNFKGLICECPKDKKSQCPGFTEMSVCRTWAFRKNWKTIKSMTLPKMDRPLTEVNKGSK